MPDHSPIHKIFGMQYRHPRRAMQCRGDAVIIISDPNDIQIAIIPRQDRVDIGAVPLISPKSLFR
jgi:hypothetical protein